MTGPRRDPEDPGPGRLALGRILGAHGLAGELRVDVWSDRPDGLAGVTSVVAVGRDGTSRPLRIRAAQRGPRGWIVAVEGVADRSAAAELAGWLLAVPRQLARPLGPGEFYPADLLGAAVRDADGRTVGRVADVWHLPAHDVVVVDRPEGGQVLVPAVRALVLAVDTAAASMTILPLEKWWGEP